MGDMGWLGLFMLAVLLPTIAGYAIVFAVHGYRRAAEARRRPPQPEPMERLVTRLRRLRAELEATENSQRGPARQHRLRAVRGAYLDVLASACQRVGVSPPPGGDLARQADIYRAEAALRARGVDVEAAAR
jgi:hypothetical protein